MGQVDREMAITEIAPLHYSTVLHRGWRNRSGEFSGYMQHRDGAAPDVLSLLMFADAFPPPAYSLFGVVEEDDEYWDARARWWS